MKFTGVRDERCFGGPRLSVCVDKPSIEEAKEEFEIRWQAKCALMGYESSVTPKPVFTEVGGHKLPVRTTKDIMRDCMTPEALAVKRNTVGVLLPN